MTPLQGLIGFLFFVLNSALQLLLFAIIINAIMSWLLAFDVINYRNRFVYQIATGLDRLTSPLMAPFRRFIPPLGGIDITPIIVIIIIQGIQNFILPPLRMTAMGLAG
ncbi:MULTISPECIES: YggT family protein [unclassified Brevundimonas]|uniref:YggT family protein n=1 Tax=unclassified Brevundimonas TaxID=2622653 RepID=UPI0025C23764|nr:MULTISPECIES: YggT family protein [unclassified Brevundimonas]